MSQEAKGSEVVIKIGDRVLVETGRLAGVTLTVTEVSGRVIFGRERGEWPLRVTSFCFVRKLDETK